MEPKLFKYVWRHSKREQVVILFLVLISLPFYFVSLDLPKSIVNRGIQGEGFEGPGSTQPFLEFDLPFGEDPTGGPARLFDGFHLEQGDYLLALSFAFLGFVLVNGMFKFAINTLKGRLGERMLRRLRYELADRVLRFPIPYSRKVKQAEIATMVKDEVEPLGGFIGDAFVTPVFLGGQALTAMVFILVQSVWLGLVAASIVLVQAFLIPKLRKRILQLGKERQLTARQLAGRIAELVDGAIEIHAHDTSNLERADIAARLGRIFRIRFEIFQRKFFVKFLNNFLAQITPFVFYSLGGMLAISGRLDIGALVAVIAAYKDLPGPIKELIDWDQRRLDVQIKYDQVRAGPAARGRSGLFRRFPGRRYQDQAGGVGGLHAPGDCAPGRRRQQQQRQGAPGHAAGRPAAAECGDGHGRGAGPSGSASDRDRTPHFLCRPGRLHVSRVGARQSSLRPETPAAERGPH
jgi:putative ABC transport system ATP-binding protein